jgi:hypothetical protein
MRTRFLNFMMILSLGSGFALAQSMPRQPYPQQPPPGMPDTQPGPTGVQTSIPPADIAAVQKNIETAFQQDPTLASSSINVSVTQKDVELTGTVPNKDAKKTAEQIAKAHAGGLDIKNHLKVEKNEMGKEQNPK